MSEQIKVWQVNDCDWWIGAGPPEFILRAYMAETGLSHDESTGDENILPRELTDEELDTIKYVDGEEAPKTTRTFREQMKREIDAGTAMPCLFASTEY